MKSLTHANPRLGLIRGSGVKVGWLGTQESDHILISFPLLTKWQTPFQTKSYTLIKAFKRGNQKAYNLHWENYQNKGIYYSALWPKELHNQTLKATPILLGKLYCNPLGTFIQGYQCHLSLEGDQFSWFGFSIDNVSSIRSNFQSIQK